MAEPEVPGEIVAELLAAGADGFVATRKAIAARARANGERDLATAIGKIRKPPRLVWKLHDAARSEPEALDQLLTAAAAARQAQASGRGQDLRDATAALRVASSALAARDTEVAQTVRAMAADEGALELLRDGRLLALPDDGDLAALPTGRPALKVVPPAPESPEPPEQPDPTELRRARAALRKAEQSVDKAERALATSRGQLADAQARVAQREEALSEAKGRAAEARAALAELEG